MYSRGLAVACRCLSSRWVGGPTGILTYNLPKATKTKKETNTEESIHRCTHTPRPTHGRIITHTHREIELRAHVDTQEGTATNTSIVQNTHTHYTQKHTKHTKHTHTRIHIHTVAKRMPEHFASLLLCGGVYCLAYE